LRSHNDELRHRQQLQKMEVQRLNALLKKEIGEDSSYNQAIVDEGWRGRAQQIVMLRAKVKRLEKDLSRRGRPEYPEHPEPRDAKDVDAKAEAQIKSITKDRRQQLDALKGRNSRLEDELAASKRRADAGKARLVVVEGENRRLKEQIRVLIGKADTDDNLIAALKETVKSLQGDPSEASQTASSSQSVKALEESEQAARRGRRYDELRQENDRLKKLVTRQNNVIDRQERSIQGLRADVHELSGARRD